MTSFNMPSSIEFKFLSDVRAMLRRTLPPSSSLGKPNLARPPWLQCCSISRTFVEVPFDTRTCSDESTGEKLCAPWPSIGPLSHLERTCGPSSERASSTDWVSIGGFTPVSLFLCALRPFRCFFVCFRLFLFILLPLRISVRDCLSARVENVRVCFYTMIHLLATSFCVFVLVAAGFRERSRTLAEIVHRQSAEEERVDVTASFSFRQRLRVACDGRSRLSSGAFSLPRASRETRFPRCNPSFVSREDGK